MAEQMASYKCPACMGPLRFDGASGKLQCDYCGSSYTNEEVERLYADALKKAETAGLMEEQRAAEREQERKALKVQGLDAGAPEEWEDADGNMRAYNCPSCGAELITDATTIATSCPYCGNPTMLPKNFGGVLKPDCLIPFKLEKQDAENALREFYKGKRLLPNSFASGNRISEVQGVYVPFWFFDGTADARGEFEATREKVFRRGDIEVTETSYYHVKRRGSIAYRMVPADASEKMPDAFMDAIEPFQYQELKPFSTAYLPGFLANKYDVPAETCRERARGRIENTAINAIERDISGYDTVRRRSQNVSIQESRVQYGLLPVYMLSTRWEGQNYLFAMNGQTGRLVGNLPVDKQKYRMYFGGIMAAFTLLLGTIAMLCLDWGTGSALMQLVKPYGIGLLLGFIAAAIACGSMKRSMQTAVAKHEAAQYVEPGSVQITERSDQFLRTTRTERRINKAKS